MLIVIPSSVLYRCNLNCLHSLLIFLTPIKCSDLPEKLNPFIIFTKRVTREDGSITIDFCIIKIQTSNGKYFWIIKVPFEAHQTHLTHKAYTTLQTYQIHQTQKTHQTHHSPGLILKLKDPQDPPDQSGLPDQPDRPEYPWDIIRTSREHPENICEHPTDIWEGWQSSLLEACPPGDVSTNLWEPLR